MKTNETGKLLFIATLAIVSIISILWGMGVI